jgi:hypothetical protein
VRTLEVGVVVSTIAHVGVIAWFGAHGAFDREPAAEPEPVTIDIVPAPPKPAPVDVAAVEGDGADATTSTPGAIPIARGHAASSGRGTTNEVAPGPTNPLMKMRGNGVDLRHLKWTPSFDPNAVPLPPPVQISGELHDSGGGTHHSDQGGFELNVDKDGHAHLKDKPSVDIHIAIPRPGDVGGAVASWYEAEKGVYGETPEHPMEKHVHVTDEGDYTKQVIVPVLGGGFNIDDWLLRRKGVDPYASRKLHVLDATRDERAELGSRRRKEQLAHATILMQQNLERVWASVHNRTDLKQALFELWDECAETGDAKLVEAGADARRLIIGFIRARLPAGSPDAYTDAELAAFNKKRQSKAIFQPYQ